MAATMKDIIKHYPVDNGDTTLIKLSDGTTILIDCKIRDGLTNSSGYTIFDVKADILQELQRRDDKPYVDVFILTHPDEDHCLGFTKNFHAGALESYSDDKNEMIVIDELWVSPKVFKNSLSNYDARTIRTEAKRRRKLYDEDDSGKMVRGNRLRVVGYDGEENLSSVPHYHPGDIVDDFAGKQQVDFSLFIHAPLKQHLIEGQADDNKNLSSIVFQARFRSDWINNSYGTRLLMAGDADHYNWDKIIEKTEKYGNEECLKWDFFLAPHHCSWTFFNDVPYGKTEENKVPKEHCIRLISEYQQDGAIIIASSKRIKNNDDNPPHYKAKQEYLKNIDSEDNFISLAETPKPSETKPVVFEVDDDGFKRVDDGVSKTEDRLGGAAIIGAGSASSGNWSDRNETI